VEYDVGMRLAVERPRFRLRHMINVYSCENNVGLQPAKHDTFDILISVIQVTFKEQGKSKTI
jgi:hypothetical protein